jgi:DNA polymerase III alpha subunit
VELTHHGYPEDDDRNDALAELAAKFGLPVVATRERSLRPARRVSRIGSVR